MTIYASVVFFALAVYEILSWMNVGCVLKFGTVEVWIKCERFRCYNWVFLVAEHPFPPFLNFENWSNNAPNDFMCSRNAYLLLVELWKWKFDSADWLFPWIHCDYIFFLNSSLFLLVFWELLPYVSLLFFLYGHWIVARVLIHCVDFCCKNTLFIIISLLDHCVIPKLCCLNPGQMCGAY